VWWRVPLTVTGRFPLLRAWQLHHLLHLSAHLSNKLTRPCSWLRPKVSLVSWGRIRLCPLGTSVTICLLYQPQKIGDDDECAEVGGIRICRGNRTTRRKPAPLSHFPPRIPRDLTCAGTRAAAVGSRRPPKRADAVPRGASYTPHCNLHNSLKYFLVWWISTRRKA
jgi:hypothetical protein